ncbi:MAG: hypothetical protein JRI70_05455 [Deltaproteobacteria bacterium]|nr:hypothetical protein [Deltaproteobacteria bacterium]MBW2170753.1 hypothetical protein [Deltaproteobacteria bacterium]MBW2259312.1 hypothetical protein [Deltaproteobacteria bacterium]
MKRAFLGMICFVAVFGIAVPAQAFELGVRGYYWFPGFSGNVKVDNAGIRGTNINFETDLGMGEESHPVIEAFIGGGNHHLSAAYYKAEYSGTATLTRDITFHGITFPLSVLTASTLEYDAYDVMYWYDIINLENFLAGGSLGIVGRVEVLDGDIVIQSTLLNQKVSFTAPLPMLGLNFHVGVLADILELRLLATGMAIGGGTVFDGLAELSLTPIPFIDINAGYRAFIIDVDVDNVEFDYDTSGPYVALTISF